MTVAFQRMFGILQRWNNNQGTPSLSKPHDLSYRSNRQKQFFLEYIRIYFCLRRTILKSNSFNKNGKKGREIAEKLILPNLKTVPAKKKLILLDLVISNSQIQPDLDFVEI